MKFVKYCIIFLLLLTTTVYSENYADIEIFVESDGSVTIDGTTNYEPFINIIDSQQFTSKKGEYWVLNITSNESFDSFVYELNLPEGAQINYIKTTPNMRIDQESSRIKLIGTGENKPFTIIVQYKINPTSTFFTQGKLITLLVIFVFIVLISSIYLFYRVLARTKEVSVKEIKEENKPTYNIKNLPERQQDIIKLIEKNKKMTQKQLEAEMSIPKSSVSRNVQTLVLKGILKKEKAGQSNYITLND
jgi:uncharacterized membrane protein